MSISASGKRLVDFAQCAGCAGKLAQANVAKVVAGLPKFSDPMLLVGAEGNSDAGVYQVAEGLAVVQTVDFFPPLVDDPFVYGQIAAANALSDVYAMGGRPITALNIVCFPDQDLDLSVLAEILRGGAERVQAAGAVVVGGHSLRDQEIKFGLSVTGLVDPARMTTNQGARPGDVLVLTKPLGTGFITTAFKKNRCPPETFAAAVRGMIHLNASASQAAVAAGVKGMTDVTGFGLGGHGHELAQASGVTIALDVGRLPLIAGVLELAKEGFLTRASHSNRAYLTPTMRIEPDIDPTLVEFVFDAQTSGGLLISVPADHVESLRKRLLETGALCAAVVGEVLAKEEVALVVRP